MAPKRTKIRKRSSTDEDLDSDRSKADSSGEVSDILSPSEVVKMRKKAKTSHDSKEERTKERNSSSDAKTKDSTKVKSTRVLERTSKKDSEKKKDQVKPKKEKNEKDGDGKESRKSSSKVLKEKEKKHLKKKMKNDDSDNEMTSIPILYPCGICTKEVSDADDAILCEAGCEYWYHRNCTGMTDIAYQLLTNEDNAEWVCDKCIATKSVPLCKLKGE